MIYVINVLGTGNLFTPHLTNTSFLIVELNQNEILKTNLIDCGYNVFDKLLSTFRLDHYLKHLDVYITHNHPDHIGSLGALIYYRYFLYGKDTNIFTGSENVIPLRRLLGASVSNVSSGAYPNVSFTRTPYRILDAEDVLSDNINRSFEMFDVKHAGADFPTYGVYHRKTRTLFTGDTGLLSHKSTLFSNAKQIFHDVIFEAYVPDVHSHILDIKNHYPKEIREKILGVHHGLSKSKVDDYNTQDEDFKLAYEGQAIECPEIL